MISAKGCTPGPELLSNNKISFQGIKLIRSDTKNCHVATNTSNCIHTAEVSVFLCDWPLQCTALLDRACNEHVSQIVGNKCST